MAVQKAKDDAALQRQREDNIAQRERLDVSGKQRLDQIMKQTDRDSALALDKHKFSMAEMAREYDLKTAMMMATIAKEADASMKEAEAKGLVVGSDEWSQALDRNLSDSLTKAQTAGQIEKAKAIHEYRLKMAEKAWEFRAAQETGEIRKRSGITREPVIPPAVEIPAEAAQSAAPAPAAQDTTVSKIQMLRGEQKRWGDMLFKGKVKVGDTEHDLTTEERRLAADNYARVSNAIDTLLGQTKRQ
jgi:hypothetical protein